MSIRHSIAIVAVTVCFFSLAKNVSARDVQPQTIDEMIAALSGDDFLAREDATTQLAALGSEALEPVRQLINHSDPEVTWRARRVLIEIASDGEEALANQAISALNEFAAAGHNGFQGLEAQIRWWRNVKTLPHAQQVQQMNQWLWAKNGGIDPFFVRRFRGC